MSIPYESMGRTAQKQRTRNALIEAARALIAAGRTPTVEEAAASAAVSRTTAYRYFANQRDLLIAAYPQIDARSLLTDAPPADVEARVEQVVGAYLDMTLAHEAALRSALRLSLDPEESRRGELLLRTGRVIGWLEDALRPLGTELSDDAIARIAYAIRAAAGIEALVWLRDVAGLSPERARELMAWSARALLRAALAEAGAGAVQAGSGAPPGDET